MKIFYNILGMAAAAGLALSMTGCKEEQDLVKPSALLSESSLTFDAKDAAPQQLTVASDGKWMVDVDSDWISVDPTSGENTVKLTVEVEDNLDGGVLAAPREGVITIANDRGYSVTTVIYQKGDNYLGLEEISVSDAATLDAGENLKVNPATVMAVSTGGFVISDGDTDMYVSGEREVKIGDVIFLNGKREDIGGLPAIAVDEVEVRSNSEATYPEPVAVDESTVGSLTAKVQYVKASGTLIGTTFIMGIHKATVLDPAEALEIDKYSTHKVEVSGYYVGQIDGQYSFVAVSLKDNGQDDTIGQELPFKDDFSWLAPYIESANKVLSEANRISDCVGSQISSADGAANIYTTLQEKNHINVVDALHEHGYTDLNPEQKTIYLQDAYLKYGKGGCQSGLTLPLFKIDGQEDLLVTFRWCAHMGGSGSIDATQLVIEIDGPGYVVTTAGDETTKISDPVSHTQKNGQMFWNNASFTVKGATTATSISFHPVKFGSVENPVSGYYRYYVDDIEVMKASEAVDADIQIDGVEDNLITFEGTPASPFTFNVTSTSDFSVSSSANWLHIADGDGLAGQLKTVSVTCDPSTLSTLRKAYISVKSGVAVKNINVVQSAAGGELEPLISIASGNSVSLLGQGAEFETRIQANVPFKTEISADWISEIPVTATSSVVETTVKRFKALPNVTGAARNGYIRFYNEDRGIESVLNVSQDKFEPNVTIEPVGRLVAVSGYGATLQFNLKANVDFKVSADTELSLSVTEGKAGEYTVPVTIAANPLSQTRQLSVTFTNEEYNYTNTVSISQYPSGIAFQDDFSWLAPIIAAATDDIGDSVGEKNANAGAPNVYSFSQKDAFANAFAAQGYEDMNPSLKVIYIQDQYLKFGRTGGNNTSLRICAPNLDGGEYTLSFDWCAQLQGSGKVDDTKLVVIIEGEGQFENGTKYSDDLVNTQSKGEMFWTNSSVKISGANESTKLVIVMKRVLVTDESDKYTGAYNYKVGGAGRFYLDNIKIVK